MAPGPVDVSPAGEVPVEEVPVEEVPVEVAPVEVAPVDGVDPFFGESPGVDMTGLESGVGVGFPDVFGLAL